MREACDPYFMPWLDETLGTSTKDMGILLQASRILTRLILSPDGWRRVGRLQRQVEAERRATQAPAAQMLKPQGETSVSFQHRSAWLIVSNAMISLQLPGIVKLQSSGWHVLSKLNA